MSAPASKIPVYTVTASDSTFTICRNGTPFKTPAGEPLTVPTSSLAETIAAELRPLTGKADPSKTPMLTLASTTLDIVAKTREALLDQIAVFGGSDLLCYRAEDSPELTDKQQKIWQPLLDWCAVAFDAPLRTGKGIMPINQPPESLAALREKVATYNDFKLAGLSQATSISGSLVLGLALIERHLTAEQIFAAAELDTTHQIEKWGEDPASKARHESIQRDLIICERWFSLLHRT